VSKLLPRWLQETKADYITSHIWCNRKEFQVTVRHFRTGSNGGPSWLVLPFLVLTFLFSIPACRAEEPQAPPEMTGSPLAVSIQALLKEGVHPKLHWGKFPDFQAQLEQLYQTSGYLPFWTQNGKPTEKTRAVIQSLAAADGKGLNAADYDAKLFAAWRNELSSAESSNPQNIASFDVGLSLSLMRYASNLYIGRINPRHVNFGLNIEPKKPDLPTLVRQIAYSGRTEAIISGLEPKLRLYENLKNALARYQTLAKETPYIHLALPAKFSPGDRHADVPTLRNLLAALGDLAEIGHNAQNSHVYDKALAEAVKRFQNRHGLSEDGVIGKSTLAQLNFPLTDRVNQIQLGLERLRWLPEQIEGRYIVVNIPSFQLYGFHNGSASGKPDIVMNVIVGESIDGRNTPVFHSEMTYLTFRPYWNLPYKITAKEMLPQILRNPGYLGRNNLEIVANFSSNATVYEPSFEHVQMLATGALKLRQKPGPKNALGLVKFAFPNTNNVYLHSTPSQGLFKKARRDFSHGCIRVENPVALAQFVLSDREEWTQERIEGAMRGDKSKTVTLKTGLPVYIFYSTVLADENGQVRFFDDIYGHDLILQNLLAKGFPYPP
jgi:murein L,D-transpeptidase YcbB/YkuD